MKDMILTCNTKWVSIPYTLCKEQSNLDIYHFNPIINGGLCVMFDSSLHFFSSILVHKIYVYPVFGICI
jgi:hypothetical protein